ncbi:MAG: sulfotransferase [Planctomycetaceae bacterium]
MSGVTGKIPLTQRVANASAGAKLALWLGGTAAICAAIQLVTYVCGFEISILESGLGRTLLILVAVVGLLTLMNWDRRPLSEYGVQVGPDWMREARRGAFAGAAAYALLYAATAAAGVLYISHKASVAGVLLKSLEAMITAVPLAATQQLIFSGYLLSLLRSVIGRTGAVVLSGVAFAALNMLGRSAEELARPDTQWLAFNLTLLTMLLAVLRLQTGSIVLPAGLLAGALIVRRSVGKSGLLTFDYQHPALEWLAPWGDPRQSPLLAGGLLIAVACATWRLLRRGEPVVDTRGPALSAEFKKFVPFSNLMALAPIDLWIAGLADARFRVGPVYLCRLGWIIAVSTINSLITLPERLLAPRLLKHSVPDPLLIVGVHRSGTTHLHNLLALDPQFTVPKNLHVLNPVGTLVMGWLVTPLLGLFMSMRRPMDSVRMHLFSAQEEEFAIAALTRCSPYWGFCFPRETARHDRYIYPGDMTAAERSEWGAAVMLFLRKLTFWRRRTPLLKSPYNTARFGEFRKILPGTKAIHICRHPYRTYLSNMHLAQEGLVAFQLQDPPADDGYSERFLGHYRRMEETFDHDVAALPRGSVAYVRYEDLVENPRDQLRRLYSELGLNWTAEFDERLQAYLAGVADYKPNRHPQLDAATRGAIEAAMGPYLDRWNYRDSQAETRRAA